MVTSTQHLITSKQSKVTRGPSPFQPTQPPSSPSYRFHSFLRKILACQQLPTAAHETDGTQQRTHAFSVVESTTRPTNIPTQLATWQRNHARKERGTHCLVETRRVGRTVHTIPAVVPFALYIYKHRRHASQASSVQYNQNKHISSALGYAKQHEYTSHTKLVSQRLSKCT